MKFNIDQLSKFEVGAVSADGNLHKVTDSSPSIGLSWKAIFCSIAISLCRIADRVERS